jgi:hypothetical protein
MADEAGFFPVGTIAKLLMLDERRIQQLVKEGWIPKADRGRYHLITAVQGYVKYLREHGRESSRGTEHARLARAQANKVEMENYRRMGELQVTAQVEETMQGLVVMMKSSHEGLPGRLASELAGISEPPRVYIRLQTELRGILDQCADYLEKRATTLDAMPEPREPHAAVSEAEPDGMGEDESHHGAGQP